MSPLTVAIFAILLLGTMAAPSANRDRSKRQFGLGYGFGGGLGYDRARLAQDQFALAETQAERMALNMREAALMEQTRFDAARMRMNRFGPYSSYGHRHGLGLGSGLGGFGSPLGGFGLGLGGINIVV